MHPHEPRLLGLIGAPGAGKDTVGAILARDGWRPLAFADALRYEVSAAWGVDIRYLTAHGVKDVPRQPLAAGYSIHKDWLRYICMQGWNLFEPRSARWVMQHWGEWRRLKDPGYWTSQIVRRMRIEREHDHAHLVITDVRYANEAALVAAHGGKLVRIHRPDLQPLEPEAAEHTSEQHHLIASDADIHNDGDIEHLEAEAVRVVHDLYANSMVSA